VTVIFRATLDNVPQPPVPTRTYVKVGFRHAEVNLGGGFDPAAARFTAPLSGYYAVNACAWFLDIAPGVLISTAIHRHRTAARRSRQTLCGALRPPGTGPTEALRRGRTPRLRR